MTSAQRAAALAVLALVACDDRKAAQKAPDPPPAFPSSTAAPAKRATFDPAQLSFFAPLPASVGKPELDPVASAGRALFFDPRLSKGGDLSCASCHDLERAGTSGKEKSPKLDVPTIVNAAGHFAQGWTARASTIDELVAPHAAEVMGADDKRLAAAVAPFAAAIDKAFPGEPPAARAGHALGAYAKKLFARSRFDRYLGGDKDALTGAELEGLATFVDAGCITCHQGKHLGATQSQKLGVAKPWPPPAGTDPGRFEVTKQEADRGFFKVPSLRNVTRTAPYIHDGSVATLEETVRLMARHQVGKELDDAQVKAIVAFLATLEGMPPTDVTAKPAK